MGLNKRSLSAYWYLRSTLINCQKPKGINFTNYVPSSSSALEARRLTRTPVVHKQHKALHTVFCHFTKPESNFQSLQLQSGSSERTRRRIIDTVKLVIMSSNGVSNGVDEKEEVLQKYRAAVKEQVWIQYE